MYALWTPNRRKYFCTRFWKESMYLVLQQANKICFLWPIRKKVVQFFFFKKQIHISIEVISYFTYDFNRCLSLEKSIWKIMLKKKQKPPSLAVSKFRVNKKKTTASSFSLYQFRGMGLTRANNHQLLITATILESYLPMSVKHRQNQLNRENT